jgi:hypothetical protein
MTSVPLCPSARGWYVSGIESLKPGQLHIRNIGSEQPRPITHAKLMRLLKPGL